MSDDLQRAASEVTAALDALGYARKQRDREAAGKRLGEASAGLRATVRDHGTGKAGKRGKRKLLALAEAKRALDCA